jgi:hypothetical protein
VAAIAFVFRFNNLGGTLGGFGNDHFAQLMRTDLLLRGEQPLRDFADSELRGAWPALSYAVSAWAQTIGGQSLLPEAYLTVGALALAYAIVFLLALDLSGSWIAALLATSAAILTLPRLYNYPKVLSLTLGALAIRLLMPNPSPLRLAFAAMVTAVASLFRHDYGAYLAVAFAIGLAARDIDNLRAVARHLTRYVAWLALFLAPSAIWVQVYAGIPTYLRDALLAGRIEALRTQLRVPSFDPGAPFSGDSVLVLTYVLFWMVPLVAIALLIAITRGPIGLTSSARGMWGSLLGLAIVVDLFFLRSNLGQRFGDASIPVVVLAAFCVGEARALSGAPARRLAAFAPAGLLIALMVFAWSFADARTTLAASGLSGSYERTRLRFDEVRTDLHNLPPRTWTADNAEGVLVAARYVAQCTDPADRLLVAAYAPEIPVFARRGFAAGQGTMSLSFYTSEADQRRALMRLASQSVPIVLADAREYEEGFAEDYPLLARYLEEHYRRAGVIDVDGEPRFLVFVDADRTPRGMDPYLGLPCFH